jgi:hypothetical protein
MPPAAAGPGATPASGGLIQSGGLIDARELVLTSAPRLHFAGNGVLGGLHSIGRPDRHQAG